MEPPPPPPPPVDLLSLPEHLQDEILKRLDLRDAVRTSALSRAWRRRWETLPGLDLSFPYGTPASVVDRVLLRYAGPGVSRFSYRISEDEEDDAHVDDWLIALSRRSVGSISIFGFPGLTVHSSIFSCGCLESLCLKECTIPPLPQPQAGGGGFGFAGFPVLKELYLTEVDFARNGEPQLRAIIRASPMLRVLVLDFVRADDMDHVIEEAPNLRALRIISRIHWRFGELPRLQYASIDMEHDYDQGEHAGFVEFLSCVSKVRHLIFYIPLCGFEMHAVPFTFSNLKSMELETNFTDTKCILLIFCLLRSSPNLEKLKIETGVSKALDAAPEFLNAQWTDGMCANLQVVEVTSRFQWLPVSFMKLILSKASLLRTLSMDKCPVSQYDQLNELLNCRKASPQAQVLFKDQLEDIDFERLKFAEKRLM